MNSKAHIKITKCYFSFINQVQHTHKRAITQPRERDRAGERAAAKNWVSICNVYKD